MTDIQGVVFDWGGVLIEDPAPAIMEYCSTVLNVEREDFIHEYQKFEPNFQKGIISEATFWREICLNLSVSTPKCESLWSDAFRSSYKPNFEMFNICNHLIHIGYKTAILSNTEIPAVQYFRELDYTCFKFEFFSCLLNLRKPDQEIFKYAINKLQLLPDEIMYIDDREEYVESASGVGIDAILFKSPHTLLTELQYRQVSVCTLEMNSL